eukprot:c17301_g1_i1 orf=314-754(-)
MEGLKGLWKGGVVGYEMRPHRGASQGRQKQQIVGKVLKQREARLPCALPAMAATYDGNPSHEKEVTPLSDPVVQTHISGQTQYAGGPSYNPVRELEVACGELQNLPPARTVYLKRGALFFRSDAKSALALQQREFDKAKAHKGQAR